MDEKIAVMDTVDIRYTHEWLDNIANELGSRTPIISSYSNMEPTIPRTYQAF
jgi:hypothetical protein